MHTQIHFIGMGGSGMSALVRLALSENKTVSGSDGQESALLEDFRQGGASVHIGHTMDNLPAGAELVIYSEAIDRDTNPELAEAHRRGLPCMTYFEALGEISKTHKTVAVAGTHGKTTTTAMLGAALVKAGLDPLVIVGSRVPEFGGHNIHIGKGDWFVVEACEYRRSFLHLQPFGVVLVNCEPDHLDYYKDEADYVSAFAELVSKIPAGGFLVADENGIFAGDERIKTIRSCLNKKAKFINAGPAQAAKRKLTLKIPGAFNELNAAKAFAAAEAMSGRAKAFTATVHEALEAFSGTARRMEIKGEKDGVLVMDDYGHHPTEIRATLGALKEKYPKRRLICVFQPHQYSRTLQLLEDFTTCFDPADLVIVPSIYEARDTDEDKAKIDAEKFAGMIRHPNARWGKGFEGTQATLVAEARPDDLILTMGAGDVYKIGEVFLQG